MLNKMITIKDLLKLSPTCQIQVLAVLSIALILNANTTVTSTLPEPEMSGVKSRVIIIGAGISGIGAASHLMQNGISDIKVLEAMDRIGGRINYKDLGEYGGVDLGGHWIHGEGKNSVFEIAEPLGLVQHSGDFSNMLTLRSDGTELELEIPYTQFEDEILGDPSEVDVSEKIKSYLDFSNNRVTKYAKKYNISENDVEKLCRLFEKNLSVMESASDGADVSLTSEFQDSGGDWLMEWKSGGMDNILHLLMGTHEKKSPWTGLGVSDKIKLSSRVSKVDWSDSGVVSVTTESGEIYKADFVIFTPSLNILKKKHKSIFNPPLPKEKVDVIEALGMGVVDKIYLVFDKPWLPQNVSGMNLLHDKPLHTSETKDWGEEIIYFVRENHNEHALGAWLTGEAAKQMEQDSDEQVMATCMRVLRKFAGKKYPDIPDPVLIVRSRWWNAEDVCGSYSYTSIASDAFEKPREILAQPLSDTTGKPVVLFAGEATNHHRYSTVDGALESGWREANRILKYTKVNKN